ncbi:uncharacterized protein LOC134235632 [Saccostrea cucullata]|uniref:uncharacterized protein LOC134235632 n=1 Tax=Saccostrea cuccullata TaxID=36930 RepID=UPI002ED2B162
MVHTVNGHNAHQAVETEFRREPEIGHVTTRYHRTGEKTVLVRVWNRSKENATSGFVLFLVDGPFMVHTVNGHNAHQAVDTEFRREPEIGPVTTRYPKTGEKIVLVRVWNRRKENALSGFVLVV